MQTLGLSQVQRIRSRILFYGILIGGLWIFNHIVPQPGELEAEKWEALGVARPYIAVPIQQMDEVTRLLIRESR